MIIEKPGEYDLRITNENVLKRYIFLDGVYHIIKSESILSITHPISELEDLCEQINIHPDEADELERLLAPYVEEVTIINAPEYISIPIKARLSVDLKKNKYIAQDLYFADSEGKNPFYATGTTPREAMRNLYETMKEVHRTLEDSDPSENEPQKQVMKQYLNMLFTRPD